MVINYKKISASGNPTAIIYGKYSRGTKQQINQNIFASDNQVEQIGYLYPQGKLYKFEMMGNEFSGNGCRAAAFSLLKMRTGKIKFLASGIENIIDASISKKSFSKIRFPYSFAKARLIKSDKRFLIRIFGSFISVLEERGSYKKARKIIENSYKRNKAVGIMFIKRLGNGKVKLNPFFYVKETNTLVNETACGSGSIATAIYLSNNLIKNIEVIQPSGQSILVKLIAKKRKIYQIEISGPTTYLGNKQIKI